MNGEAGESPGEVEFAFFVILVAVAAPGRPPRRGTELRNYLRRWVGAALPKR